MRTEPILSGVETVERGAPYFNVTLADAMIAAITRLNGCGLWRRNKKHYPMLHADDFYRE
jgi:predicted nucleic acid-binding protein